MYLSKRYSSKIIWGIEFFKCRYFSCRDYMTVTVLRVLLKKVKHVCSFIPYSTTLTCHAAVYVAAWPFECFIPSRYVFLRQVTDIFPRYHSRYTVAGGMPVLRVDVYSTIYLNNSSLDTNEIARSRYSFPILYAYTSNHTCYSSPNI